MAPRKCICRQHLLKMMRGVISEWKMQEASCEGW